MAEFDDKGQQKKLAEIRLKEEEDAVARAAAAIGIDYINLGPVSIETDALKLLPETDARAHGIAFFKITGKHIFAAVKNIANPETLNDISRFEERGFIVTPYLVSAQSLEKAWGRYKDISGATRTAGFLDISQDALKEISETITTSADVDKKFKEIVDSKDPHLVSRLMELIFGSAIAVGASDIHIEQEEGRVRLRFRLDGVLQDVVFFNPDLVHGLISRIKLLSEMKLTQEKSAQDGRFTINYKDTEIEIRTSIIPGSYGESVVMRILNPESIAVGFDQLGIEPRLLAILEKEIAKPNGLILTTGPTGSGKTTTLYAFLRKIYTPEIKVITIEDPIEYHIPGITQTQIEEEKSYTFLNGLRAALRQDPDVIMVGEIRDAETAKIAINSSLTGHLVLSTLHTNNAAGTIPRLLDLGITPQILASGLTISMAQRLVRKLCPHCKRQVEPTEEQKNIILDVLARAEKFNKPLADYKISSNMPFKLWTSDGCDACNHIGYKGRIGLYEAILMQEEIEKIIYTNPTEREIEKAAALQGIFNMQEDAVIKMILGTTSYDEVTKVVDLELNPFSDETGENSPMISHKEEKEEPISFPPTTSLEVGRGQEVSVLVDYLKNLENEQKVRPDESAEIKIRALRETILRMLIETPLEEIFTQTPSENLHSEVTRIINDLKRLEDEQREHPSTGIAHKLTSIRSTIENL